MQCLLNPDSTGCQAPSSQIAQEAEFAPRNDFQNFVQLSLGYKLPIFGRSLFENAPSTFAPLQNVPAPSNYMVGPGDQIQIRAWGQLDVDYTATVDPNGTIYIPKVGVVSVVGVRNEDLTNYVKRAVSRVFHDFDLTATLAQLRSVQVFVVGQAQHPGSYTVSSLSTLVDALFASGGPSLNGSMRHIQLKRGDKIITEFDLYQLLLQGDKSKDVNLLPGDVIYIEPLKQMVAVAGSVNNPALYELDGPTTLAQLLQMAGGLSTTAEGKRVTVERINDRAMREVQQFEITPEALAHDAQDGDLVRVVELSPRIQNAVTLRGNVARPGRYPWHEGMKVNDLIPNREALVTPEFWKNQNAMVGVVEPESDYIKGVPRTRGTGPERTVEQMQSQEQNQTNYEQAQSATENQTRESAQRVRTDVTRNAPDINWDYAVIERLNLQEVTTDLVPFNLGKAIDGDPTSNLELRAGDVITIFSQDDLRVPIAKQNKFIRLEGEINNAGIYQIKPGETLKELLSRVGGLTPNAYLFGSQFFRESSRREQQQRMDDFITRLESDLQEANATEANGLSTQAANPGQAADFQIRLQNKRRIIASLRAVKATGRVVLDLRPSSNNLTELPELQLEDGDTFVVPPRLGTISVVGAVFNPNDVLYAREKRLKDYLRDSGGPTRTADTSHIYVIRADGSVRSKQRGYSSWIAGDFASMRLEPGDAIVVPEQVNKVPFITNLKDWSQVLANFALGAAAIKVLSP